MEHREERGTIATSRVGKTRGNAKLKVKKSKFRPLHFPFFILDRRGFSLLELLVVLLLLGLSAAIVLPSFERGLKAKEVRRSALEIAAVARNLRNRAIYESTFKRLIISPSENSYEASRHSKVHLSKDIRFTGIEGGEPLGDGLRGFVFYPNGSALGGEIGISGSEGSSYIIRLEPLTGRVVVLKGNIP